MSRIHGGHGVCPFKKGDMVIGVHDNFPNYVRTGWVGVVESFSDDMIVVKYSKPYKLPDETKMVKSTCCFWWRFERFYDVGQVNMNVTDVSKEVIGAMVNEEYLWKSIIG